MESAETYSQAIKAALAFTGTTRQALADAMGVSLDTLGRRLKKPKTLTLDNMIKADLKIHFTRFLAVGKR